MITPLLAKAFGMLQELKLYFVLCFDFTVSRSMHGTSNFYFKVTQEKMKNKFCLPIHVFGGSLALI